MGWAAHASRFEFVGGPIEYAPDIRRFLNGTPNVPTMYSARSSYEIVNEIGTTAIRAKSKRQIIGLADEAGLLSAVRATCTLCTPPAARGGTVILDVPNGREVTAELCRRHVLVDFRPGRGIRIAPHFYTSDDEIAHIIHELRSMVNS